MNTCILIDSMKSQMYKPFKTTTQGLALREAQLAVAAGTNAMLLCGTSNAICQLQALSPAGRCRTLDASADG